MPSYAGLSFLEQHAPDWARRILYLGCGEGEGVATLRERGFEVYAVESDPAEAAIARQRIDDLIEQSFPDSPLPFPKMSFDLVILGLSQTWLQWPSEQTLRAAAEYLHADGVIALQVPNPDYWRRRAGLWPPGGHRLEEIRDKLAATDLRLYQWWRLYDQAFMAAKVEDSGPIHLDGHDYRLAPEEDRGLAATVAHVAQATRRDYDPVAHAARLRAQGWLAEAYNLLARIPADFCGDARFAGEIAAGMQGCLIDFEELPILARVVTGQSLFYGAAAKIPENSEIYRLQATLWRRLGDANMARRILAVGERAAPSPQLSADLEALPPLRPYPKEGPAPMASENADGERVLFIAPEWAHYGVDTLYDGLCEALGEENVFDLPWKPSLHGEAPPDFTPYPCTFSRRKAARISGEETLQLLADGAFSAVLIGHLGLTHRADLASALAQTIGKTPVFVLDQEDGAGDYRESLFECIGRRALAGYFKREMLIAHDYGPDVYPMPFSYVAPALPPQGPRTEELFWAGQRGTGVRGPYLKLLESRLGRRFDQKYSQEEYRAALHAARIGLNLFGLGFDTVRYWELPAHGCLLFTEEPPIRIPHNFVDGESAVFFRTPDEFEAKLDDLLKNPKKVEAIAAAGRRHFLQYHTHLIRARQLLGWMRELS